MGINKPTLLTGIRASGDVHLGNYLGAMQPAIALQSKYNSYLFIADLHGLTSTPPASELNANIRSVAAAWLAAGVDVDQTVLWRQSHVPEVLELSYILTCVTSFGLMERAHSVKDAKAKGELLKSGIVFYPLLMAADILLYEADFVPVGKDQAQHLEMTRDMATFFNETYGDLLKLPKELIQESIAVIPGTDGRKMSKSYQNGINIFSDEKVLKKQVMGIVTDSKSLQEKKEPEENLIYQIFKLIASPSESQVLYDKLAAGGFGYGDAKKMLLELMLSKYDSMRNEYWHWMRHPDELDTLLISGADKAREKASKLIKRIKAQVGL